MNKFIAFAFVAVSAFVLVAGNPIPEDFSEEKSELSLNPTDEFETGGLKGTNLEGFSDFCLQTRDTVIGDLKNRGNVFTSDSFAKIFRSLGEVAQDGLAANKKAVDALTNQLSHPDAPIEGGDEEVDKIIAESQEKIQQAGGAKGVFAAFMGGLKSFATVGYGSAIARIMELKSELGNVSITENLIVFCEQLSTYEKQAIDIFEETKKGLVAEDAAQYQSVKYSDVAPKCITANRLSRAEGFCKFVLSAKEPLAKAFNFKLPGTNADH